MKHNDDGQYAEEKAAEFLSNNGYKILDRNWKTRQCEIDIVAKKNSCVYFVEVKYRTTSSQGTGFEYITDVKLRQMSFAAEYWVVKNRWEGEFVLSGMSVSGTGFDIEFIEVI